MSKLPYMQFYPDQWMTEAGLRACSLAARGLWMDLLCHMWKATERGVLKTGKQVWGLAEIANAVSVDPKTAQDLLSDLLLHDVTERRKKDGALICRRMVREEKVRKQTRKRVAHVRDLKRVCNADVTREKSDVRSHKEQSQNLRAAPVCGNVEKSKPTPEAAARKQISDAREVLRVEPESRGAKRAFDEGNGMLMQVAAVAAKKAF